jgi:SAM-dependent methyltransferase
MNPVRASCEVCDHEDFRELFSKAGYPIVKCVSCGHVFLPIDLDEARLRELYEVDFFSDGSYADYVADKESLQRNFGRFIEVLKRHGAVGSLLEIGCAYGFFLELAEQYWDAEGVDIQEPGVTYAREELHVKAIRGDFLELPIKPESFDVIVMWDTIEHLAHPAAYLSRISQALKPNGILALTTGDVRAWLPRLQGRAWRLYHPPYHLHYFSPRTLFRIFERFGLRLVDLSHVGFHRSLDMMLYRTLAHRKPRGLQAIYRMAKRAGLAGSLSVYLNLFDIMLVIARKE